MLIERVYGHTFFKRFINNDSIVVDLGANIGRFSSRMIEKFGCQCYAVEANPVVFNQILLNKRLNAFNLAIAAKSGSLDFFIAENSELSSLYHHNNIPLKEKVAIPAKRLDRFVESLNISTIDLLKVDIEGAEIEVIDSCTDQFLKQISQLAIEFHDFNGLVPAAEVARVTRRLNDLGFLHVQMTRAAHGHEDTIFINRSRCPISPLEFIWVRYISRNFLGLKRILQRRLKQS